MSEINLDASPAISPLTEGIVRKNGPKELMAYFSVPTKGIGTEVPSDGKVTMPEFRDFWSSLNEGQKSYYRQVELV